MVNSDLDSDATMDTRGSIDARVFGVLMLLAVIAKRRALSGSLSARLSRSTIRMR